jgi:Mn2+/Fe2+ NRAMP family transporter
MDATDAQLAPARTPLEVLTGARLFISDVEHLADDARVAYHLADHVWELGVARVFGVAMQDQSVVVKMVLTGALATVAGSFLPRPHLIRPSTRNTAIGASILNAAGRGIAGAPSQHIPAAGVLIGLAVLAHSIRSAVAESSRDVHRLSHEAGTRYGHHSATSAGA